MPYNNLWSVAVLGHGASRSLVTGKGQRVSGWGTGHALRSERGGGSTRARNSLSWSGIKPSSKQTQELIGGRARQVTEYMHISPWARSPVPLLNVR